LFKKDLIALSKKALENKEKELKKGENPLETRPKPPPPPLALRPSNPAAQLYRSRRASPTDSSGPRVSLLLPLPFFSTGRGRGGLDPSSSKLQILRDSISLSPF